MAFSLRKMLSNISYFKKPEDSSTSPPDPQQMKRRHSYVGEDPIVINFEPTEPDSTSRHCNSLKLPESIRNFAAKKGSLSDTDLLTLNIDTPVREKRRKCKKLKLDIRKASRSLNQLSKDSLSNAENTPKHVLLECKSSDIFSERFRGFDFNKSFDLFDAMSDDPPSSPFEEEDLDIESLSDHSDSDASGPSHKSIKMCRKVTETGSQSSDENQLVPTASLESFSDVVLERNEEERMRLLLDYQKKMEKMERFLQKLFNEFQFHIEVSKVFRTKSIVTALPGTDITNLAGSLEHVKCVDIYNVNERDSNANSWNVVMEKDDIQTKLKIKNQLLSTRQRIDIFIKTYLETNRDREKTKSVIFNLKKNKSSKSSISYKKKLKHFDFPDIREAMINLFSTDNRESMFYDDTDKCLCKCHEPSSPISQTDSGLATKSDGSMSISSSIGNFSLDSSTLTAYSESLDQVISYNSFQDTSLYSTLLQKAAIERITFYVQVHSIQLKSEEEDSKNTIIFHCSPCKETLYEENGLLKHILSQTHCEKIHFLYKTAYIKKCVASGQEIMPSTVLNPMTMYRDDNKIVCFGDAVYACTLCFENLIVGESILMAHCADPEHIDRREKLAEIIG